MATVEERLEALEIVLATTLPHMSRFALSTAAAEVRSQIDAVNTPAERAARALALNFILAADTDFQEEVDDDPPSPPGVRLAKAVDALQLLDRAVDALVRDFAEPNPTAGQLDQLADKLTTKPSFLTIVGDLDMARAIAAILRRRATVLRSAAK